MYRYSIITHIVFKFFVSIILHRPSIFLVASAPQNELKISAIFDGETEKEELAFRAALRKINARELDILPEVDFFILNVV